MRFASRCQFAILISLGLGIGNSSAPAVAQPTVLRPEIASSHSSRSDTFDRGVSIPSNYTSILAAVPDVYYRLIVQADTPELQAQVKALVSSAFHTTINGQQVMQVGVFRDRAIAEALHQQFLRQNLHATILPIAPDQSTPNIRSSSPSGLEFSATQFNFPEPSHVAVQHNYSLWATYYYLHQAQRIAGGTPLRTPSGQSLGVQLSKRDWCAAALQGSVVVVDGQKVLGTYNYAGVGSARQVDCSVYYPNLSTVQKTSRSRFLRSRTPFGEGVSGFMLVPYRTIAVDRRVIPIGSVIYIPEARGQQITLPSGEQVVHDGYFYAADVGGAITGRHIDVFLGSSRHNPFSFVKSMVSGTFRAYLINDPQIRTALESLHRFANSTARHNPY